MEVEILKNEGLVAVHVITQIACRIAVQRISQFGAETSAPGKIN
jgi:hypothetical protein